MGIDYIAVFYPIFMRSHSSVITSVTLVFFYVFIIRFLTLTPYHVHSLFRKS